MSAGAASGIPPLRPVPLQELRLRADALLWPVDQKLADLDSLTPVRGQLWARHHGSVLEVEGEAETIVTLCCDRCLQHFNRPLRAAVHELLELAGGDGLDGSDLTALAGSAAQAGAPGARFRTPGAGAGGSGASAPGGRAAGRPPTAGRDRSRGEAAAGSDLSPSRSLGQGQALRSGAAPGSGNASVPGDSPGLVHAASAGISPGSGTVLGCGDPPSSGGSGCAEVQRDSQASGTAPNGSSQPRRASRSRSQAEPLLIEALDDRLDPRGAFDPERWLFEQLSLQLPVVNRCGADCPGPPQAPGTAANGPPSGSAYKEGSTGLQASQPPNSASPNASDPEPAIDPRWAALRQLLP